MKEIPILFNCDMVRAILDGRKTQTRRPIKLRGNIINEDGKFFVETDGSGNDEFIPIERLCPYGQTDDLLWVRETFFDASTFDAAPLFSGRKRLYYRADEGAFIGCHHWRPSIHMPRWAARLFLRIKSIRVQRLQDVTVEEARAEGFESLDGFFAGWISCGYDLPSVNPFVWAIEFERVKGEIRS